MDQLVAAQQALVGQLAMLTEQQATSSSATAKAVQESSERLTKAMNERLEQVQDRVGNSLQKSSKETAESLATMTERLAAIDKAQENITKLSTEVVGLQHILDDKQARGAFGEVQLEAIVEDALPKTAYEFQCVLSNGKRADCLIKLPNPPGSVVVDAKFPLTAYRQMLDAGDDSVRATAARQLKKDVLTHIRAIADKYIVSGQTADSALMFLPSEAVYAELHAHHADVIEASYRARVYIVSPTTMMATLTTVRAVLRGAEMRKQAAVIQTEVGTMLGDVSRLSDRVTKLRTHFDLANRDIDQIETSAGRVQTRGTRIHELDLGAPDGEALPSSHEPLELPIQPVPDD
ncbi:MAG: DNA recombination protein RmuC [Actinobacteria bacterium]|nr:DNA recombination protein RmuC [Actinomycetota bacterium]MBU1494504.1 DNA recombination protein RmuC [Actinomycetota bacterium]MBU1865789.1 DNA recombination protein RmuC [Actinomycetota bacterium]